MKSSVALVGSCGEVGNKGASSPCSSLLVSSASFGGVGLCSIVKPYFFLATFCSITSNLMMRSSPINPKARPNTAFNPALSYNIPPRTGDMSSPVLMNPKILPITTPNLFVPTVS